MAKGWLRSDKSLNAWGLCLEPQNPMEYQVWARLRLNENPENRPRGTIYDDGRAATITRCPKKITVI